MSKSARIRTEHETEILVLDQESSAWVEVVLVGGGFGEELDTDALSLTPAEARAFADALLTQSQRTEDRLPHGNS